MASLGDLMARVGADVSGFSSSMGKVSAILSGVDDEINRKISGFDKLGSSLTSMGTTLSIGITAPLVGIGAAATSAFGEFQGALARASALGDIYGKDLERLKAQAIELGAKTQFSAKQAADGMAELAAAGFNTTQVVAAMPAVLNLAAAGQISVGQSAEIAANIMGGFNIRAEGVGHAVDVMAKAAASGSLGMNDLAYTMKYVGPVATAAGLSFEEVTAATTLLSNAGIKGEQAGTGLRGAIASLIEPSKKGAIALKELGVETTDATGKLRPLDAIFSDLRTAGATTADVFKIFGRETASAAQKMLDFSGKPMQDMTAALKDSDGAADKMAKTLSGGLGGAMERMKGSVETASIKLGEVLAPTIIKVAGMIEVSANKVAEWIGWFQKLPEPVQMGALALGALAAAAGPVVLVAGTLIGAWTNIVAGLGSLVGALKLATAEVTTFAAAKTALAGVLTSLAIPALVAVAGAILGIQVVQIKDELGQLYDAFTAVGVGTAKATDAMVAHKEAQQQLRLSVPQNTGFVKALTSAFDALSEQFGRMKWSDILTPLGFLRRSLAELTDVVKMWRGVWPEMGKAAETALKKLQTETQSHMRIQAENATKIAAVQSAHMKANEEIGRATKHTKDHTEAIRTHLPEAERFNVKVLEHVVKLSNLREGLAAAIREQARMTLEFINGVGPMNDLAKSLDGVKVSLDRMIPGYKEYGDVMRQVSQDGGAAMREATATIKQQEIDTKAATEGMTAAHKKHGSEVKSTWGEITQGIDSAISGFSRNLSGVMGDLFNGEFSIGKVGDAFKQLGLDIVNVFLKQATDAIASFISGALADLLSGKGLGGIVDSIKGIGSALGGIFGGGAGAAADAASGAAGAAGGAAGSVSQAAGAATSGISGMVTAVSSVVSALASVGNLFVGFRQEGSLNGIEHNTRYSMMYLGERGDGGILGVLFKIQEIVWYGPAVKALEVLKDSALYFHGVAIAQLSAIQNSTYYTLLKVDEIRSMMAAASAGGDLALADAGGGSRGNTYILQLNNGTFSTQRLVDELFSEFTRRIQSVTSR